jgi:hypothetical protein
MRSQNRAPVSSRQNDGAGVPRLVSEEPGGHDDDDDDDDAKAER